MVITKTAISRRQALRGLGITMGLPFLDAMVPAATALAKTAATPPIRLGFFYVANGCTMVDWHCKGEGTNFELSPILSPLAPYREYMVEVAGLANRPAGSGAGNHTRCHATWLNGVTPKRTEGADIQAGTTMDQHAAQVLGKDTPLTSLELSLEPSFLVGNCDNGFSCVYMNTFSWRTPTMPMPMENNPRAVFERLFGDGSSPAVRAQETRKDLSILDYVNEQLGALTRSLGPSDRIAISDYAENIREVEKRIQKAERQAESSPLLDLAAPTSIPVDDDEYYKLMFELNFLAYRADITRVVSFQIARETSARTYPQIGVTSGHHDVSHHQKLPERMAVNTKINTYHMSLFAKLVEKMHQAPDGDGTLLDHSILMYGSGMGDGDLHSPMDLPVLLVGGGGGQLKGGRVVKYADGDFTPIMNLELSLLDKVGVHLDSLGDSTGRLSGI